MSDMQQHVVNVIPRSCIFLIKNNIKVLICTLLFVTFTKIYLSFNLLRIFQIL